MSNKNKNQPEVSQTGADLISAAKAGEAGNPGPNVAPGTETEPSSIPAVPGPNVNEPKTEPNEPAAPLTQPTIPIPRAGAPLTPPVRQQDRISGFTLEGINEDARKAPTEHLRAIKNVIDGELETREPATKTQTDTVVGITYDGKTIEAQNGDTKTTFTQAAWDQLPKNKKGWKEVLKTPPEVEALKK